MTAIILEKPSGLLKSVNGRKSSGENMCGYSNVLRVEKCTVTYTYVYINTSLHGMSSS